MEPPGSGGVDDTDRVCDDGTDGAEDATDGVVEGAIDGAMEGVVEGGRIGTALLIEGIGGTGGPPDETAVAVDAALMLVLRSRSPGVMRGAGAVDDKDDTDAEARAAE